MVVIISVVVVLVAFVFIWRAVDVRLVLLVAMLSIGALAGKAGAVFTRMAEALADPKFVLPTIAAMGFAFVVRETGCAEALVELLARRVPRSSGAILPGATVVPFVVNIAIPGQTSALAASGPMVAGLMARFGTGAAAAGMALVYGASSGGALLNPGLPEVAVAASSLKIAPAALVISLAPAVLLALLVGLASLAVLWRLGRATDPKLRVDPKLVARGAGGEQNDGGEEANDAEGGPLPPAPTAYRILLPVVPIATLLLAHPSLPTHRLLARILPQGLEVFTVLMASAALTIAVAAPDRSRGMRALFEGTGYAYANIITLIAMSTGLAKALDLAGVFQALARVSAGSPTGMLGVGFAVAFLLGLMTGSGTASSMALFGSLGAHGIELGANPGALYAAIMFGAETGRTASPTAAVLLFGSKLVEVPPRTLSVRLLAPCVLAGAAGTWVCALRM
jgi:C4-dicarboxylate transporter, DcuC family